MPTALRDDGWGIVLHDDHFADDTPDETIFARTVDEGWVLVTQDKRIRQRPAERQALIDLGVRAFSVASTANLSADVTIEVLRVARPEIERTVAMLPAPFVVAIYKDGSLIPLGLD